MPELPEILVFARDMQKELADRTISGIEVLQPKCLNVEVEEFQQALTGAKIISVAPRGKWLQVETTGGWLLLSLGMGGEILLTDRDHLPEKHRLIFDLADGACVAVNFWWFGYAHYAADLADHKMTAQLGPNMLNLTLNQFRRLLHGRRGGVKSFLLNQKHVAGIGNVYIQDPLFKAKVHPLRQINTLSDDEVAALWQALRETLQESVNAGSSAWEQNLYGEKGKWGQDHLVIGYKEGQPCPVCGTEIAKIKTGSTSGYVCPTCQPLDVSG